MVNGDVPKAPLGVRPRLSDWYDLPLDEQQLSFVIPRISDDLPLNLDPFLLFNSDKASYQILHDELVDFMERVRIAVLSDRTDVAFRLLEGVSEPIELGLGYGTKSKHGRAFGPTIRKDIVSLFSSVPQLLNGGMTHVEALALLVGNVAEDRISDLTASVIRQHLIDFTSAEAELHRLPTRRVRLDNVWDANRGVWRPVDACVPLNPADSTPILFAPRDLLRTLPFINYEDYYSSVFAPLVLPSTVKGKRPKPAVLEHNRLHYALVDEYVRDKESRADECLPSGGFQPLSKATLLRKVADLERLASGNNDRLDKQYERLVEELLTSLLAPELDCAQAQSRTISGAHVRDLIFYNDAKIPFTSDLRRTLDARQLVFEIKNVKKISGEHINQISRYLIGAFGRFGIIVTRNRPSRAMMQNMVDLYSSCRKQVVCLTDEDLRLMVECVDSGRRPIDVVRRACINFERLLPN